MYRASPACPRTCGVDLQSDCSLLSRPLAVFCRLYRDSLSFSLGQHPRPSPSCVLCHAGHPCTPPHLAPRYAAPPPLPLPAIPPPPWGETVIWPKKHRKYWASKLNHTVILWYSLVVQSPPPRPGGGTVTALVGRLQGGGGGSGTQRRTHGHATLVSTCTGPSIPCPLCTRRSADSQWNWCWYRQGPALHQQMPMAAFGSSRQ